MYNGEVCHRSISGRFFVGCSGLQDICGTFWNICHKYYTIHGVGISSVRVTKPVFSLPLFSEFVSTVKAHVSYWISRLYMAGVFFVGLTHWSRAATHICVGKLTIIGSDNGLSPGRRQAIIRTNAGTLLIGTIGTNFSEILCEIHTFSFKKMHLKMSYEKWRPFCLGLNVSTEKMRYFDMLVELWIYLAFSCVF